MYQEVEALYQTIKSHKNATVIFDYMPDETHATVIHQAVYNAFKMQSKK
jgi:predicted alpha/beta superfamily hydrolase